MSENFQNNGQLSTKQHKAIAALLTGQTKGQAATAAGVTTRTLLRWHDQPLFEDELRRRSTQAIGDAGRRLTGSTELAVGVLVELAEDEYEQVPFSVRLSAARAILDAAIRLQEMTDLEQRVKALEERLR